jgi:ribosome biogenesis GTPase A
MINWYPGHMAKTKRLIKERINLIDIIYEVVDARIPSSSKIKDIDEYIKNKPRILIMAKADLCDMSETKKWINYYEELGYQVVPVDLLNNKNLDQIFLKTKEELISLNEKRVKRGLRPKTARALVIGIPNVGKSTLINRLVGKKAVKVGNKPGITKALEWIRINKDLELLDSPGILWPKIDNEAVAFNLASLSAIKEEILPLDEVSIYILRILYKYYPQYLKDRYDIEKIDFDNIITTLDIIGKKRGCLIKGGEIDYLKVYLIIINDLNNGDLGLITFDRYDKQEKS